MAEDRLRQALVDGDWELPEWADVDARLARIRKRQARLRTVGAVAGVAILTAAVLTPILSVPKANGRAEVKHLPIHLFYGGRPQPPPLPPVGSPAFPDVIYPPSDPAIDAVPSSCPNPENVSAVTPPLDLAAYKSMGRIHHDGDELNQELTRSDRSMWGRIDTAYANLADIKHLLPVLTWTPVSVAPALESWPARIVARHCGRDLVADSTALLVKTPLGLAQTYVLQRDGHLLTWGMRTGVMNYHSNRLGLIFGPSPLPHCAYPITVRGSSNLTRVQIVERNRSKPGYPHGMDESFRCTMSRWPSLYLSTAERVGDFPHHHGPTHALRLGPGDAAVTTISGERCHEEPVLYSRVIDETSAIDRHVTLTIAPCGLRETGWHRLG